MNYWGIAELIIFKQSIRKILVNVINSDEPALDQFYTSEYFIIIIVVLAEIPFTIVKKIEKLKFMALLGVIGIIVFVIFFIIYYFTLSSQIPKFSSLNKFPDDAF